MRTVSVIAVAHQVEVLIVGLSRRRGRKGVRGCVADGDPRVGVLGVGAWLGAVAAVEVVVAVGLGGWVVGIARGAGGHER